MGDFGCTPSRLRLISPSQSPRRSLIGFSDTEGWQHQVNDVLLRQLEKCRATRVLFLEKSQFEDEVGLDIDNHTVADVATEPLLIASYKPESKSHC